MDWRQILVLLLIFVPLERLFPARGEQKILRDHAFTDTVYLLVNSWVIRLGALALVLPFLDFIDARAPAGMQDFIGGLPFAVQLPFAILVADLGFYLHHRLFHAVPALWRLHAVHHSIEELDWLAAHRIHPLDQLFSTGMSALPLYALGFSAEVMAAHALIFFLHSHLVHSNTRLGFGPLDWLIASPRFHHWHHANAEDAHDRNFGGQLLVWDRLFGTLNMPASLPSHYGIDDPMPSTYPRQLAWPFLSQTGKQSA
jgi:sterol desaturase/sphingolipid hydroxylase (fatty acid hydroxylase superfamily)